MLALNRWGYKLQHAEDLTNPAWQDIATLARSARRITMHRDAVLMIHAARLFAFGTEDELACAARRVARTNSRLREIIAQRTEQPLPVVDAWLAKDSYFTAPEALAAGLIDAIIEPPAAPGWPTLAGCPISGATGAAPC